MCSHVGSVTSSNQLVEDYQLAVEGVGLLACDGHSSDVTSAIEGSDLTGVVYIVGRVADAGLVEHDVGHHRHGHTLHVVGKQSFIFRELVAVEQRVRVVVQDVGVNHFLAVVAEEYVVGKHVGTDFQLYQRVLLDGCQSGAVTAYKDRTHDDSGILSTLSGQTNGHLLCIRTVGVEGFDRCLVGTGAVRLFHGIVEVAVGDVAFQLAIAGVWVGTVSAAIGVASDGVSDTYGAAAIYHTRHVVAAIDIVDVAAAH